MASTNKSGTLISAMRTTTQVMPEHDEEQEDAKNERCNVSRAAKNGDAGKGTSDVPACSCAYCKKIFKNDEALRRHSPCLMSKECSPLYICRSPARYEGAQKLYHCDICGASSNRKDRLIVHIRSHTNERPYVCDVCNKTFTSKRYLKGHKTFHRPLKRYHCAHCNNMFTKKKLLIKHLTKSMNGKSSFSVYPKCRKSYLCHFCGKTFYQSRSFREHTMAHKNEIKPYVCNICNHAYSSKDRVKRHIQRHTDRKMWPCPECNKPFTRHNLSTHINFIHRKKTFPCVICNRPFPSTASLTRHAMIHTNVQPYSCSVCNRLFNQKSSMKRHMMIHNNEKPFTCALCDKSFIQKVVLKSHLLKQHMNVKANIRNNKIVRCKKS